MDKFAQVLGKKAGDMVEGVVKSALGAGDKDKKKEKKDKGGLFSFGNDKKKDEEKGGFMSKVFSKDDDKGKVKKSGFDGLFAEAGVPSVAGGDVEGTVGACDGGGGEDSGGQSVGVNDGDLFSDLMEVAQDMSTGE